MKVVNKRTHRPTERDVYIGRPSVFGNPYRVSKDPSGDRELVIAKYRHRLETIAHVDPDHRIMQAIRALPDDAILVCWCAPLPCHGTVIVEFHDRLKAAMRLEGGVS